MAPTSDKHADGQQGIQPGIESNWGGGGYLQRSASLNEIFEQRFGFLSSQTRTGEITGRNRLHPAVNPPPAMELRVNACVNTGYSSHAAQRGLARHTADGLRAVRHTNASHCCSSPGASLQPSSAGSLHLLDITPQLHAML